jgi:Flp pilus assembly protein CpaB
MGPDTPVGTSVLPGQAAANGSGRVIRRRRPVVSGRAATGGLLVAAAGVLVFSAWLGAAGGRGRPWVVARVPLAAGTTLRYGEVGTARMSLAPQTARVAFADPGAVLGRTLAAPVAAGGLVQAGDLVPNGAQPAWRPVTVAVDPSDAGALGVGGLVDILVTNGSDPSSPTTVVDRGARVISVGSAAGAFSSSAGATVTIGVRSLAEVTAIVHAEHTGTVSLVAGEPSDGEGLGAGGSGAGPAGAGG